jgi:hypothetical protein
MGLRPIVLLKSPYIMRLALYLYRILPTNFSNEPLNEGMAIDP